MKIQNVQVFVHNVLNAKHTDPVTTVRKHCSLSKTEGKWSSCIFHRIKCMCGCVIFPVVSSLKCDTVA